MTLLWLSVIDCSGMRVELALFGRGKSWAHVTDMFLTHAQRPCACGEISCVYVTDMLKLKRSNQRKALHFV